MKNILLFALIFLAALGISAQTQFQRTAGTTSNDRNYHLAAMPGGSLYATGYTESVTGNLTDAFLVKYNRFGQVEWAKTYGETGNETNWDVIVTQNLDIIGVGYSSDIVLYNAGVITRTDSSGNVIWCKGVGSMSGDVNFYRVIETSTGHIVATGLMRINNIENILYCKFTATGDLLWSRIVSTPQDEEIMGLIETAQGHYLFAGLTNDALGNGGSEFAVVKTDTAGNVIWKKRYGGTGSDRLNAVVEHDNEYYFLGWSNAGGIGNNDAVVMKTDTAGNINWVNGYGTLQADRVFNMLYDPDQNSLIVAGYTDYSDSVTNNRNTLLMSLDLNGQMNWARSYGSTSTDGHWPTGLAMQEHDKGYYVLGSTNTFGPGNMSLYLTKTDAYGNTACNQKNPDFSQQPITGWNGAAFGTDSTVILISSNITITGMPWTLTESTQCCELYNNPGPDQYVCDGSTVDIGQADIPGYTYAWTFGGNPVGSTSHITVPSANAGTYLLTVSAPGTGCTGSADPVVVTWVPLPDTPQINSYWPQYSVLEVITTDSIQWFFNGLPMPGETGQQLNYTQSGYYQVQVTNQYGCSYMSDSMYFTYISVDEILAGDIFVKVFPNPASDRVHLELGNFSEKVKVSLLDIGGRVVFTKEITTFSDVHTEELSFGHLPQGHYRFLIVSDKHVTRRPLMIVR